jgi:hypothetical protein
MRPFTAEIKRGKRIVLFFSFLFLGMKIKTKVHSKSLVVQEGRRDEWVQLQHSF